MSKFNYFKNYFYSKGYELGETRYKTRYFKDYDKQSNYSLRMHLSLILPNGKELLCRNEVIDGFEINEIVRTELDFEVRSTPNKSILPLHIGEYNSVKKKINLDRFYEDLVEAYNLQYKNPESLDNEILKLVNKYGMLTTGIYEENIIKNNDYIIQYQDGTSEINSKNQIRNLLFEKYEFHIHEYMAWEFLFESFIPSTLEYVPKSRYNITIEKLNQYVSSMRVDFQDKHLKKYLHRSPNLIAELIMHSKSIKSKKPPMVQCSQCKKAYRKQSIGRGRPIEYCSDACKQAAWRAGKTKKNKQ